MILFVQVVHKGGSTSEAHEGVDEGEGEDEVVAEEEDEGERGDAEDNVTHV